LPNCAWGYPKSFGYRITEQGLSAASFFTRLIIAPFEPDRRRRGFLLMPPSIRHYAGVFHDVRIPAMQLSVAIKQVPIRMKLHIRMAGPGYGHATRPSVNTGTRHCFTIWSEPHDSSLSQKSKIPRSQTRLVMQEDELGVSFFEQRRGGSVDRTPG